MTQLHGQVVRIGFHPSMEKPMTTRRRRASKTHQPGLFDPPLQVPTWSTVAPDIRATVTKLAARMLRAYWEREDGRPPKESNSE